MHTRKCVILPFQFLSIKPAKRMVTLLKPLIYSTSINEQPTVSKLYLCLTSVSSNSTPGMSRGSISCNSGQFTCKYEMKTTIIIEGDPLAAETESETRNVCSPDEGYSSSSSPLSSESLDFSSLLPFADYDEPVTRSTREPLENSK